MTTETKTKTGELVTSDQLDKLLADGDAPGALKLAMQEIERMKLAHRQDTEIVFDSEGRITNASMGGLWRLATLYAASKIIPDHFRKEAENCFIAIQMAMRCNVEPFAFLQCCYVVHGKPGIESKLAIAMLNRSGLISDRISYELAGEGMQRQCIASATVAGTGQKVTAKVTMKMAKDEGWYDKSGSKWKTLPDLMLQYRSAMFLIRTTFPEVLMGMQTREELADIEGEIISKQWTPKRVGKSRLNVERKETPPDEQTDEMLDEIAAAGNKEPEREQDTGLQERLAAKAEEAKMQEQKMLERLAENLEACETIKSCDVLDAAYCKDYPASEMHIKETCNIRRRQLRNARKQKTDAPAEAAPKDGLFEKGNPSP